MSTRSASSHFLLGVSGALYGSLLGTISVDTFFLDMTFMLVAMLVVGGLRSVAGAVVGVTAVSAVVEIFRQLQNGVDLGPVHLAVPAGLQGIALALFMLGVLIFRHSGLTGGRLVPFPPALRRMLTSEVGDSKGAARS